MNKEQVKCKFCKSDKMLMNNYVNSIMKVIGNPWKYQVYCPRCGACGPSSETKEAAFDAYINGIDPKFFEETR